jgi:Wiskott-Aldrich syndrome protein
MDGGSYKLLESATHRTLHAHSFSRASSQASHVLTDLLSRYLTLLSSTCAKYAHHAGRTGLTARDAIGALDELGVGLEELSEYCSSEGRELGRYAIHSARRVEDMNEFKGQSGCALHLPALCLMPSSSTCRWSKARS